MKFILSLLLFFFAYASNINSTKKALYSTKHEIARVNYKLDRLAREILNKEKTIKMINNKENRINFQIETLEKILKNSGKSLNSLYKLEKSLKQKQNSIQNEIIKFISQNYYLDTKKIASFNDLVYSEITQQALKVYSKKIAALSDEYKTINNSLKDTNTKINGIINKKNQLEAKKRELLKLKKEKIKELLSLKKQKEIYKKRLLSMIRRQENLRKKLQELKIVRKRKRPIHVKKLGSVYFKPKISYYRGRKTIPPVYGKVVKRFGSYIDPIYKIRIYNDSITIKTKRNALIRSIMNGIVVYIGENNGKKVIFIKHRGDLFSIYANLSKISPLLKKGSYVKRGQIIARVNSYLEFEVTYKDNPINPLKVIKLK